MTATTTGVRKDCPGPLDERGAIREGCLVCGGCDTVARMIATLAALPAAPGAGPATITQRPHAA